MCQLLESIKITNNLPQNLRWHQQRLNASQKEVFGEHCEAIDLQKALVTSQLDPKLTYKARIIYGKTLHTIEITPYLIRPVASIKVIEAYDLAYPHKYVDRADIDRYFAQKDTADDILITKNGFLTDCSYANICLWDGSYWYTPAKPLLAGTKRAQLLENGSIFEKDIHIKNLGTYHSIALINAMLELGAVQLPIDRLIY